MLIACWGPKGGAGTTTVAVSLAILAARRAPAKSVLVDLAGDVPAVLGMADPVGEGVRDWLAAPPDVPATALEALQVEAPGGVLLLPGGEGAWSSPARLVSPDRVDLLVAWLARAGGSAVLDCGTLADPVSESAARATPGSLAVMRPCYLAVRRALGAPLRPDGAVLVADEGRSLGQGDISDVLGVPVLAQVATDPAVSRAVDAGLLARRLPRSLARPLGRALDELDSGAEPLSDAGREHLAGRGGP